MKKETKKLELKKSTIAMLNKENLNDIKGGRINIGISMGLGSPGCEAD